MRERERMSSIEVCVWTRGPKYANELKIQSGEHEEEKVACDGRAVHSRAPGIMQHVRHEFISRCACAYIKPIYVEIFFLHIKVAEIFAPVISEIFKGISLCFE